MPATFVVEDIRFFRACLEAVVNLVEEGVIEASAEGLHLRSMDPSQIAMVDWRLPSSAFARYEIAGEAKIAANLVDVVKILGRARPDERLTLTYDEHEAKLLLEFFGKSRRRFKLPLLTITTPPPKEPRIAFDARLKMPAGVFKDALHDAGLFSSHVVFEVSEDELIIEAKGDAGELKIEMKKGELIPELVTQARARAMFPYEYLDDITKAAQSDALLELSLKSDAPICIAYSLGEARLVYYLAPRVESI